MNHCLVSFIFITLFLNQAKAWYEWYIPVFETDKILVENQTDSNQDIWMTSPITNERTLTLSAYEKKEFSADELQIIKSSWFKLKSFEKNLKIYSINKITQKVFEFDRFISSNIQLEFQKNLAVYFINPNYKDITIEILCYNKYGVKKITHHLKVASQTLSNILFDDLSSNLDGIKKCTIKSEYLAAVYLLHNLEIYKNYTYQKVSGKNLKEQNGTYFNVSDDSGYDFIIKLTDKDLIANARNQIKNKNMFLPRLLVAKVDYGHGGFNFNLSDPYKNNWNWHVSQVYGFKDFGSTSCNGFPQYLQENLKNWIDYNNGLICFWTFQVNKEIAN